MAIKIAGNRYAARNSPLTWRRPKNGSRAIAYAPGMPISRASSTDDKATKALLAKKPPKPWPPLAVEASTST